MTPAIDHIKKLVAANRPQKALGVLYNHASEELQNKVVLQQGALSRFHEDKLKGILTKEDINLFYARLNHIIVELAEELPPNAMVEVGALENNQLRLKVFMVKNYRILQIALLALVLISAIILFSIPKYEAKFIVDITVKKASLTTGNYTELDINQEMESLSLENFDEVSIPVTHIETERNEEIPQSERFVFGDGLMILQPLPDQIGSVVFDRPVLESLHIPQDMKIALSTPQTEGEAERLFIIDAFAGDFKGSLAYSKKAIFEVNNTAIKEPFHEIYYNKFGISDSTLMPLSIAFSGGSNPLRLIFSPPANQAFSIETKGLFINNIEFTDRAPGSLSQAESSIIDAKVAFANQKNARFQEFSLAKNQFLVLKSLSKTQITSLNLHNDNIKIRMEGFAREIKAGSSLDGLVIQNPNMLIWIIYNKLILLIIVVIVVGAIYGALAGAKKISA